MDSLLQCAHKTMWREYHGTKKKNPQTGAGVYHRIAANVNCLVAPNSRAPVLWSM